MSEPYRLTFTVEAVSHEQEIELTVFPGSTLERLYAQFRATDSDDDFTELANWVREDLAGRFDIDIVDVN